MTKDKCHKAKIHNEDFFLKKATLDTIDGIISTVVEQGLLSLDQMVEVAEGRYWKDVKQQLWNNWLSKEWDELKFMVNNF